MSDGLPDINQYITTPEIQAAGTTAADALSSVSEYQSAAALLPAKLKQALLEKVNYNQDIIEQQSKAMANYFAAPSAAREEYAGIWDPFAREKLVAQAQANAYAPYATLTGVLGQRMGTLSDIISAGTGAFNAAVTSAQNKSTLARQRYQDLLDIAKEKFKGAQWGYEQTHAKPTSTNSALETMITKLVISQLETEKPTSSVQPTETEPRYSPLKGEGSFSPGRQWVYHSGEWMVNADAVGKEKPPLSSFVR